MTQNAEAVVTLPQITTIAEASYSGQFLYTPPHTGGARYLVTVLRYRRGPRWERHWMSMDGKLLMSEVSTNDGATWQDKTEHMRDDPKRNKR